MAVSFDEYLRRGATDPNLRGRETQDIQSALQAISSYQTNRAVGEVLGAPAEAKPREGVLRRFMRGIDAPRRAVAAGLLDIAGFQDPALRRMNPLQSAAAGFRGDIDVSGGDVFRLTGRESLPTKALKLGGAFALDVATDPLTYIGTPAALGRKSAATLAARTSQATLRQTAEATARRSGRAVDEVENELVERLFRNTGPGQQWSAGDRELSRRVFGPTEDEVLDRWRRGRARGIQRKENISEAEALQKALSLTPKPEQLAKVRERMLADTIDNMTDARARKLGLIGQGTQFRTVEDWQDAAARGIGMIDAAGNRIASNQWKRTLAEQEFGRILGESLLAEGRVGLRRSLSQVAGDTEVAEEVFRQLPDRVRGGLFLTNPITGKTITRLTEGTGESLGAFGAAANAARLQLSAFFGKGTQYISGTRGKAFQNIREDLAKRQRAGGITKPKPINVVDAFEYRTETLSNYLGLRTAQRLERLATIPAIKELSDVASDLSVLRRTSDNVEEFDQKVLDTFYNPAAADASDGAEIAGRLRNIMDNVRARLLRAGVQVGNLGENYTPKITTPEGLKMMRTRRALAEGAPARAGAKVTGAGYDASRARSRGFALIESTEDAATYGFAVDTDLVALNAIEANKRELAEQMLDVAGGTNQARRVINQWLESKPAGWRVADATDDEISSVISQSGARNFSTADIVKQVYVEDPLEAVRHYVEQQTPRIAAGTMVQQGLRLGIFTRTSEEMVNAINERQAGEFIQGIGELNRRVQARLKKLAEGDSVLARKLTDAVDPATGQVSTQELEALGLMSTANFDELIRRSGFGDYLPDSVEQVAALREAVSTWAKLNYARQAGQRLTAAQNATLARAQGVIEGTSRSMEQADFAIQQIDNMFADVMGANNFTAEEMRFLSSVIDNEYRKLNVQYRSSLEAAQLPVVEGAEAAATRRLLAADDVPAVPDYWLPPGDAPVRVPVTADNYDELLDLEVFIGRSSELSGKASDEQIAKVIEKFYNKKDVQSPVDRALELLGMGRIGADPVAEGVISVGKELADLRATAGVREIFEARQRIAENPSAMKEFFDKVYDPLFLVWKNGATVGRGPGYTFLNMVGNLYMNLLGDVGVVDHKLAAKVVQAVTDSFNEAADELVQRTGLDLTRPQSRAVVGQRADEILRTKLAGEKVGDRDLFDLWTEFVNAGGVESSQIGEALATIGKIGVDVTPETIAANMNRVRLPGEATAATRRVESVVNAFMNNRYQQTMNTVNTNVETWTRFAAFTDAYRSSGNIDVAMERMYLLHFDYGDLSNIERSVRRVFPFYVWTRNNVPAQVRAMFVQPGKIRRLMEAQETFKLALSADEEDAWLQEVLPDYIGEVGGFASSMTSGPFNVAFASKMPYDDVDRLIQTGGSFGLGFNMREIAQMVGPFTLALEAIFQRDFSTGGAFDPLGREATGWRRGLAAIPGVGRTGRYGEARIPTGLDKFVSELIPQVGTAERALTGLATAVRGGGAAAGLDTEGLASIIEAPAGASMRERGFSNLLNVTGISPLTGMSATTLTPRTISSTLRDRRTEQLAIIGEAAGQAGVSLEWVREMLRQGYTPDQIAVMMRSGAGNIERYEAEQAQRSSGPNERYNFLLDQLRRGGPVTGLGYAPPSSG